MRCWRSVSCTSTAQRGGRSTTPSSRRRGTMPSRGRRGWPHTCCCSGSRLRVQGPVQTRARRRARPFHQTDRWFAAGRHLLAVRGRAPGPPAVRARREVPQAFPRGSSIGPLAGQRAQCARCHPGAGCVPAGCERAARGGAADPSHLVAGGVAPDRVGAAVGTLPRAAATPAALPEARPAGGPRSPVTTPSSAVSRRGSWTGRRTDRAVQGPSSTTVLLRVPTADTVTSTRSPPAGEAGRFQACPGPWRRAGHDDVAWCQLAEGQMSATSRRMENSMWAADPR